jgi:biotin transport system permease protein
MLGLYVPGATPVHRASASLKLGLLFAAGAGIAITSDAVLLAAALAAVLCLAALARLPPLDLMRAISPALFTILLFTGLQAVFAGWSAALMTALKTTSLVLAASLVTLTTRFADMIDALTAAARPLRRLGLSPAKTGLAVALAIRFIPVLMKDYRDIQDARLARGGSRWGVLALGPLLIKTLRMTSDLSDAITARGFDSRDGDSGDRP